MGQTLFDKVWDSHVIEKIDDGPDVLFIDRHMVHEAVSYTHLTLPTILLV